MILTRLYELAEREHLLDDLAFELLPVPFVIQIGEDGRFLGIVDTRVREEIPSKKKGAAPKTRQSKGKELSAPKPHGNPANRGFARFFTDTLARVLPLSDVEEEKAANSRKTFWAQVDKAAEQTKDPALLAVARFGERLRSDGDLVEAVRQRVAEGKPGPGDRCTFAYFPDAGATILERDSVRTWFASFFQSRLDEQQAESSVGICQLTGKLEPLPTSHATTISLPGGLPQGVRLVSNDKAAFESYKLDGAVNSCVGARASEGYSRAANALIANRLPSGVSSFQLGEVRFLFWTREPTESFWGQLDNPDPAEVEHLITAALRGKESTATESSAFYCLCLSPNAARAIVRDYLELPIEQARANLGSWFADLRIFDRYEGAARANFSVRQLAASTARAFDEVAPDVPSSLLRSALQNLSVPDHVLAACLRRLAAEGTQGFTASRMALIKLSLIRKGLQMTEELDPRDDSPAYICGRLFAVFDQIQNAALGKVNTTIVDRFYGAASTAPSLVFGRLFAGAQNHLQKLRGDKEGIYKVLNQKLTEVAQGLAQHDFPRTLSVVDQGRFALGFYHQLGEFRSEMLERKAAKEAKAEALS